ncbi:MAG: histidine phosphatase family protein [Ktedonobacteraceae bacterium]
MDVYLIRHGQSENNLLDMSARLSVAEFNHILRHDHASPLSKTGEQQVCMIGEKLRHAHIERVYSSPYPRALATAQAIGQRLELTVQVHHEIHEVRPLLLKQSQRTAALSQHFWHSYIRMLWPWGCEETWLNEYRRAQRIWTWIEAEPTQNLALVSHGGFIRLLLLITPRHHRWRILQRDFSNGGISLLTNKKLVSAAV